MRLPFSKPKQSPVRRKGLPLPDTTPYQMRFRLQKVRDGYLSWQVSYPAETIGPYSLRYRGQWSRSFQHFEHALAWIREELPHLERHNQACR